MFGPVGETELDVRFTLLGVPVRVHPLFWISSGFLVWYPDRIDLTLVGIVAILLSVLVHEMGHALINYRFGFPSNVVLSVLGGYATSRRHSTWRDIAVSAAGPAAGLAFAAVIYLPLRAIGFIRRWTLIPYWGDFEASMLDGWPAYFQPGAPGREMLLYFIQISIFFGILVNLMNLVPVLPLDGGQISRELFLYKYRQQRKGMTYCLTLSMWAAGAIAVYAILRHSQDASVLGADPVFLAIMFGYLGFQSYQALELHKRGYQSPYE